MDVTQPVCHTLELKKCIGQGKGGSVDMMVHDDRALLALQVGDVTL